MVNDEEWEDITQNLGATQEIFEEELYEELSDDEISNVEGGAGRSDMWGSQTIRGAKNMLAVDLNMTLKSITQTKVVKNTLPHGYIFQRSGTKVGVSRKYSADKGQVIVQVGGYTKSNVWKWGEVYFVFQ